jgi:hypothetical protein
MFRLNILRSRQLASGLTVLAADIKLVKSLPIFRSEMFNLTPNNFYSSEGKRFSLFHARPLWHWALPIFLNNWCWGSLPDVKRQGMALTYPPI